MRLNYLSSQPRQTSYAINDSDILGAPQWFAPPTIEAHDRERRGEGRADRRRLPPLAGVPPDGAVSGDVVDIPN